MKIIKAIGIVLLGLPWLFISTTAVHVDSSNKSVNCTLSKIQRERRWLSLGSAYISGSWFNDDRNIILPIFNLDGDITYAKCDDRDQEVAVGILDGFTDWPVGTEVVIHFVDKEIRLFGIALTVEESIIGIGTGRTTDDRP